MEHSPVYLWTIVAYFVLFMIWEFLNDPDTFKPADISKPDLGHRGYNDGDDAFYWSMMMNQDEQ